jgi:hypothetical protein
MEFLKTVLVIKLEEKLVLYWGDSDLVGKIILRWIMRKWDVGVGIELSRFRIGTVGGHL